MHFHIITIFPEYFDSPLKVGLLGKAITKGLIRISLHNLRDFTTDPHRVVDDVPYGGGEGMVFKPEPLHRAISYIKEREPEAKVIYLTPQGRLFTQRVAEALSREKSLILICGRYEGIDERIREKFIDEEISIGDYVLFGGEAGALVVIETISRLIPGVIGKSDSVEKESFTSGLLKYPCYTRPREFLGLRVPDVLLSGDHTAIERYRRRESLRLTLERRPELLKEANLTSEDFQILGEFLKKMRIYILLLHYPVYNRQGEIIASAITNLDLHDLARLARTYDLSGVYVIHPDPEQRSLAEDLIRYWTQGRGGKINPLRSEAMKLLLLCKDFDEAIEDLTRREGEPPILVGTDASPKREFIRIKELQVLLWKKPIAIVLGTAWGLTEKFLDRCDYFLEPIWGRIDTYNHLSVRTAGSILIDRLLGVYTIQRKIREFKRS